MSPKHDSNLRLAAPILDRLFDVMCSGLDVRDKRADVKPDWWGLTRTLWRIVVDWKESESDAKAQASKHRIGDEEWIACAPDVVQYPPVGLGLIWIDVDSGEWSIRVQPEQTCLEHPDIKSAFGNLDFAWIMARALRARKESSEMPNRRTPTRLEEVNRLVRSKGGRVKLKTLHGSMHSRLSIEKFAHELLDMGVKIEDDGGIRYVVGDQG